MIFRFVVIYLDVYNKRLITKIAKILRSIVID